MNGEEKTALDIALVVLIVALVWTSVVATTASDLSATPQKESL